MSEAHEAIQSTLWPQGVRRDRQFCWQWSEPVLWRGVGGWVETEGGIASDQLLQDPEGRQGLEQPSCLRQMHDPSFRVASISKALHKTVSIGVSTFSALCPARGRTASDAAIRMSPGARKPSLSIKGWESSVTQTIHRLNSEPWDSGTCLDSVLTRRTPRPDISGSQSSGLNRSLR